MPSGAFDTKTPGALAMQEWTDDDGTEWISSDCLCVGDYCGTSDIGEANIRSLTRSMDKAGKDEDYYLERSAYSTKTLWIRKTEDNLELIKGLEEDYPLIDDACSGEVICDWEREAWESWLRHDLIHELPEQYTECADDWTTDEKLWEAYREVMEETNTDPHPEGAGVYIEVGRILPTWIESIRDQVRAHIQKLLTTKTGHFVFPSPDPVHHLIAADYLLEIGKDREGTWLREWAQELAEECRNEQPTPTEESVS